MFRMLFVTHLDLDTDYAPDTGYVVLSTRAVGGVVLPSVLPSLIGSVSLLALCICTIALAKTYESRWSVA